MYRMPFDPLFWRPAERSDAVNTWNVAKDTTTDTAPIMSPENVRGFIVGLPTDWTFRENNQSGMNLTVLADNESAPDVDTTIMQVASQDQPTGTSPRIET